MRHYLATLHKRSPEHKNRFALLVSAAITLSIFTVWSAVRFQGSAPVTATKTGVQEVSPLRALSSGVATAFQALTSSKQEVKKGLEQVPLGRSPATGEATYGR